MKTVYEMAFKNSPAHAKTWSRYYSELIDFHLLGSSLYECDENAHIKEFVVATIIDRIIKTSDSLEMAILNVDETPYSMMHYLYNIINDDNELCQYISETFESNDQNKCIVNKNTGSRIYINTLENASKNVSIFVLEAQNNSWSAMENMMLSCFSGSYKSIHIFNNGLIIEDSRNKLHQLKMDLHGQNFYRPICALNFDRANAKYFIANNTLGESINKYPCTIKEALACMPF